MTDFRQLLRLLANSDVEFIVIGGVAAAAHGSARVTYDLDLAYGRNLENIERLIAALAPYNPYMRGAPPGLPFRFDVATVKRGLNFTLTTSLGDLDLLGEVTGGGGYEQLREHAISLKIFDVDCLCINLEKLIEVKRAAGRPKDLEVIAELESLYEEG